MPLSLHVQQAVLYSCTCGVELVRVAVTYHKIVSFLDLCYLPKTYRGSHEYPYVDSAHTAVTINGNSK